MVNNIKKVKVGRNDKCPCSSGKKYKHCCYSNSNLSNKTQDRILSAQMNEIEKRLDGNVKYVESEIKMSEVISEFAAEMEEEYGDGTNTAKIIELAILYWNASTILSNTKTKEDELEQLEILYKTISVHGISEPDFFEVLEYYKERKAKLFPNINRMIVDYRIDQDANGDVSFSVASAIPRDEVY
ncbi:MULTISPECIES: YecA family protein [Cysteiniphilum]|uniref:YecA family protein n=1 Tax=Cysteiniphilum TaxID=2056696 RepID=UPI001784BDC8|nr:MULTISPECIES: SEC-C domain-containing protein [Cysteiniphilum]